MTLLVKLGIAVLGGGSIAAGSYGVYEFMKPKTIKEQLKWEGFDFPDVNGENDDNFWDEQLKIYETETKKNEEYKFKKAGTEEEEPKIDDKNSLKQQCEKALKLKPSDKDNLEKARKWCVKSSK